jgi:hypothetical protein
MRTADANDESRECEVRPRFGDPQCSSVAAQRQRRGLQRGCNVGCNVSVRCGLGGDARAAGDSRLETSASVASGPPPDQGVPPTSVPAVSMSPLRPSTAPVPPATETTVLDDALAVSYLRLLDRLEVAEPVLNRPPYDRGTYQPHGWADLDGDCVSGRHETLLALSEVAARLDESGCFVETGSWAGPYMGQIVTEASEIIVDHVVSLSEADRTGERRWDSKIRIAFANDEAPGVLIPVV